MSDPSRCVQLIIHLSASDQGYHTQPAIQAGLRTAATGCAQVVSALLSREFDGALAAAADAHLD